MDLDLRQEGADVTLRVRVQPRAARDGLAGARAGALVVRLCAPPVDGAANAALRRLLGDALGIAPSRVAILRGGAGRDKLVRLEGVEPGALRALLAGPQAA